MSATLIFGLASIVALVLFAAWRALLPRCPRCRAKEWDRRLCAPLLFCRRCATRIDYAGQLYN